MGSAPFSQTSASSRQPASRAAAQADATRSNTRDSRKGTSARGAGPRRVLSCTRPRTRSPHTSRNTSDAPRCSTSSSNEELTTCTTPCVPHASAPGRQCPVRTRPARGYRPIYQSNPHQASITHRVHLVRVPRRPRRRRQVRPYFSLRPSCAQQQQADVNARAAAAGGGGVVARNRQTRNRSRPPSRPRRRSVSSGTSCTPSATALREARVARWSRAGAAPAAAAAPTSDIS